MTDRWNKLCREEAARSKSQMVKRVAAKLRYRYRWPMSCSLWRAMICIVWFSIAAGYFTLFHSRIWARDIRKFLITACSVRFLRESPFSVSRVFSLFIPLVESHSSTIGSPFVSRFVFNRVSFSSDSKDCRNCSRFSRNDTAYIPHRRTGFSSAPTLRNDPTISERKIFVTSRSHRAANRFYRTLLEESRESPSIERRTEWYI